jgi:hypothetical protein
MVVVEIRVKKDGTPAALGNNIHIPRLGEWLKR